MDGSECSVAGNYDAEDVSAVVVWAAKLHSRTGRRDAEGVKVVLKSLEG